MSLKKIDLNNKQHEYKMKLIAATTLAIIIGAASAVLPPGCEDQIWCPENT